jgi:hypothetical protein
MFVDVLHPLAIFSLTLQDHDVDNVQAIQAILKSQLIEQAYITKPNRVASKEINIEPMKMEAVFTKEQYLTMQQLMHV